VGVRGEESATESRDTSEFVGDLSILREGWWSGGTEVASESVDWVTSEAARTVVDGALIGDRALAGLAE